MRMKRIWSVLLVLTLLAGLLAGCGTDASADGNTSGNSGADKSASSGSDEEPYTVIFVYISGSEEVSRVEAAIDALAMEQINMHVKLRPLTWGTYLSNLNLVLSANEDMDILVNFGNSMQEWLESGYIQDWAPYLDLMPDVMADMEDRLVSCYTGDVLTGIPANCEIAGGAGFVCRKDIMDELGYSLEDFSVDTADMSTFDQMSELFAAVKEAHPEMTVIGGYNAFMSVYQMGDTFSEGPGGLILDAQDTTVVNFYESDLYRDLCGYARDWFNAGYTSADAATQQDSGQLLMAAGNLFCFPSVTKPNTKVEAGGQTGYEVVVIPAAEPIVATQAMGAKYCLSSASKNPEKAAICYNWMYTNAEVQDLLNWGIEGEDWIEDENGQAAFPEGIDVTTANYHNDFGYMYPNQFIGHAWTGNDLDIWDQYREYNANVKKSAAYGFSFDAGSVRDQISQCTAVYQQYDRLLGFGAVDPNTGIQELNDKLYAAGLQDIMDEKQRQLDEWLAERE